MRDANHGKRGVHVATDRPTDRRTDVPLLRSGAAAPSSNERGDAQAAVVAAFIVGATSAGLPVLGRARGIIAGQAGLLLDDGWPLEAILRAVDRFARRRRFAGHLAQWCRENAADEREGEHFARKEVDRLTVKDTMRSLARAMKDIGL